MTCLVHGLNPCDIFGRAQSINKTFIGKVYDNKLEDRKSHVRVDLSETGTAFEEILFFSKGILVTKITMFLKILCKNNKKAIGIYGKKCIWTHWILYLKNYKLLYITERNRKYRKKCIRLNIMYLVMN